MQRRIRGRAPGFLHGQIPGCTAGGALDRASVGATSGGRDRNRDAQTIGYWPLPRVEGAEDGSFDGQSRHTERSGDGRAGGST